MSDFTKAYFDTVTEVGGEPGQFLDVLTDRDVDGGGLQLPGRGGDRVTVL